MNINPTAHLNALYKVLWGVILLKYMLLDGITTLESIEERHIKSAEEQYPRIKKLNQKQKQWAVFQIAKFQSIGAAVPSVQIARDAELRF